MYCPKCGSSNLIRHGKQWRLKPRKGRVQRWRCNACGKFTVYPSRVPLKEKTDG